MRDHHALTGWLADVSTKPFGGFREFEACVRFADAAVAVQTGERPIARLGHTWNTPRGVVRLLKRLGGLGPAVDLVLAPIAPARALRGDIALIRMTDGREALVVVEGETLVGPHANGVRRIARAAIARAWSAGG